MSETAWQDGSCSDQWAWAAIMVMRGNHLITADGVYILYGTTAGQNNIQQRDSSSMDNNLQQPSALNHSFSSLLCFYSSLMDRGGSTQRTCTKKSSETSLSLSLSLSSLPLSLPLRVNFLSSASSLLPSLSLSL